MDLEVSETGAGVVVAALGNSERNGRVALESRAYWGGWPEVGR
jgi:hypothetical protein